MSDDDDTNFDQFNRPDPFRKPFDYPAVTVVKNRQPVDPSDNASPFLPQPSFDLSSPLPPCEDKWLPLKSGMKLIFLAAAVCCGLYVGLLFYLQTCDNPEVRRFDTASKLEQAVRTAKAYPRGHIEYSL